VHVQEPRADAALIKGLKRRTAEDVIEIGKALMRQRRALEGTSNPPQRPRAANLGGLT